MGQSDPHHLVSVPCPNVGQGGVYLSLGSFWRVALRVTLPSIRSLAIEKAWNTEIDSGRPYSPIHRKGGGREGCVSDPRNHPRPDLPGLLEPKRNSFTYQRSKF